MVQINMFPIHLETYSMCSEAPAMLAGFISINVINPGNFKDKTNLRKYKLSLLLSADEATLAPKGEDLLWVIRPVGFRIRTRN